MKNSFQQSFVTNYAIIPTNLKISKSQKQKRIKVLKDGKLTQAKIHKHSDFNHEKIDTVKLSLILKSFAGFFSFLHITLKKSYE